MHHGAKVRNGGMVEGGKEEGEWSKEDGLRIR
jgi:hypothetical protein